MKLDETHDMELRSWVDTANDPESDFPVQNLPFGVFRPKGGAKTPRVGVAIGDMVLDLSECKNRGLFDGESSRAADACCGTTLNPLLLLPASDWKSLRRRLSELLQEDGEQEILPTGSVHQLLVPQDEVDLLAPVTVGDYTDFYSSVAHATNIGKLLRPDNPLLPNYKYIPIGYHGRASSLVVSGTSIRRPFGQSKPANVSEPKFGPSAWLDYEAEFGAYIGGGNDRGIPVPIDKSHELLFGFSIVNDWSARDIQSWEYQPLGPFLSKSFATSLSPWVVTSEALRPYRVPAFARGEEEPKPLPYLFSPLDQETGGLDVTIEVLILTRKMREAGLPPHSLSRGSTSGMYWTFAQLVAHHTSNGCNLRAGDLLASGTISGDAPSSFGSLMEITSRGQERFTLPTDETRAFLEDGDEVIMRAYCAREGAPRIGFGECRGILES